MIKQTVAALALGSLLALGGMPAMAAQHAGHQQWSHHGEGHSMMLKKLDLTAEQQTKVQGIMKANYAQMREQRAELRGKREAFGKLKPTDGGYQAAADALAQAEGQAATARVERMAKVRAEIYGVLTPQQQAKWATLQEERRAKRAERKQQRAARHAEKAAQPEPSTQSTQ